MYTIFLKEIRSFLSSLIAYVVMIVFLAAVGFFMWILKGFTVFDSGAASMAALFELAPYLFIFLVSAITMRSFSDEKRLGTIEIITTKPISDLAIIMGKFFACLTLVLFSLLPTLIYYYSISKLGNPPGNMDTGGMWGSYFGLLMLGAAYVSIGIFCSVISDNQIVALIFSITWVDSRRTGQNSRPFSHQIWQYSNQKWKLVGINYYPSLYAARYASVTNENSADSQMTSDILSNASNHDARNSNRSSSASLKRLRSPSQSSECDSGSHNKRNQPFSSNIINISHT